MNGNVSNTHRHRPGRGQGRYSYVVYHDFDGAAKLSTSVVHAISDATGVDPTDAGFCLNDHVDPDALDRLFTPKPDGTRRGSVDLTFTVWGYRVTVDSSGRITIVPPRPMPDTPQQ